MLTVFISVVAFLGAGGCPRGRRRRNIPKYDPRSADPALSHLGLSGRRRKQSARIYRRRRYGHAALILRGKEQTPGRFYDAAKRTLRDSDRSGRTVRSSRGSFESRMVDNGRGSFVARLALLPQTISLQRQSKGIIDTFRNDYLIHGLESAASTANTEAQSALFNLLCFVAFVLITLIAAAVANPLHPRQSGQSQTGRRVTRATDRAGQIGDISRAGRHLGNGILELRALTGIPSRSNSSAHRAARSGEHMRGGLRLCTTTIGRGRSRRSRKRFSATQHSIRNFGFTGPPGRIAGSESRRP